MMRHQPVSGMPSGILALCLMLLSSFILLSGCDRHDSKTATNASALEETKQSQPTAADIKRYLALCTPQEKPVCACAAPHVLALYSIEQIERGFSTRSTYQTNKAIFAFQKAVRPIMKSCLLQSPLWDKAQYEKNIAQQDLEEQSFYKGEHSAFPTVVEDTCLRVYGASSELCDDKVRECALEKATEQYGLVGLADRFDAMNGKKQFESLFSNFLQTCHQNASQAPAMSESDGSIGIEDHQDVVESSREQDLAQFADDVMDDKPNGD